MNTTEEVTGCSNGPVSSMPGSRTLLAEGIARCDDHEDRWAQYRVQGETDSFGCEYLHLCASCADAMRIASMEPKDGYCEWHKGEGLNLRPFRDMDEGMAGPVYMTCQSCRDRVNEELRAELARHEADDDFGWWDNDSGRDDSEADRLEDEARWAADEAKAVACGTTSRVRRASKRLKKKARKIAQAPWQDEACQGATLRACVRHFNYFGGF